MKTALSLLTAAELPTGVMAAVASGAIPKGDLATLCELVAQRAREEMREAAALEVLFERPVMATGGSSPVRRALNLAADAIRALPVTPKEAP